MSYGHNGGPPLSPDSGWVAIARSMREHPIVGFHLHATPCDANRGAMQPALAFIDLIMECRYQPGSVNNNGRIMRLDRGQLVGATSWLALRWNWTPKAVRGWLDKLEAHGMISLGIETTPGTSQVHDASELDRSGVRSKGRFANVITICNYDKYQLSKHDRGQVDGQDEGQVEGRLRAGCGQVAGRSDAIYPRARETKEQGNQGTSLPPGVAAPTPESPAPAPQAAVEQVKDLLGQLGLSVEELRQQAEAKQRKALRAQQTAAENERTRSTTDAGLSIYNKAAAHFGFSLCESFTEKRRARMAKRIDDIGGIENFRQALWAIRHDEFLLGRKAKPGGRPFRLTIDLLLSTDTGMGDVLGRLMDLAKNGDRIEAQTASNGKSWGWWRDDLDKLKVLKADYWQRRFDALRPNGTWPWWELGPPPGHAEALIDWDAVMGMKLSEIYRGEVEHA